MVFADYLMLVALVGIVVATVIVVIGIPMYEHYQYMQAVLTSPVT